MNPDEDLSSKPMIRVVCAALRCRMTGLILAGVRHRFIREYFVVPKDREDGFLTNQNQFVDRQTAWKIAEAAGQIQSHPAQVAGELHSEDLY